VSCEACAQAASKLSDAMFGLTVTMHIMSVGHTSEAQSAGLLVLVYVVSRHPSSSSDRDPQPPHNATTDATSPSRRTQHLRNPSPYPFHAQHPPPPRLSHPQRAPPPPPPFPPMLHPLRILPALSPTCRPPDLPLVLSQPPSSFTIMCFPTALARLLPSYLSSSFPCSLTPTPHRSIPPIALPPAQLLPFHPRSIVTRHIYTFFPTARHTAPRTFFPHTCTASATTTTTTFYSPALCGALTFYPQRTTPNPPRARPAVPCWRACCTRGRMMWLVCGCVCVCVCVCVCGLFCGAHHTLITHRPPAWVIADMS